MKALRIKDWHKYEFGDFKRTRRPEWYPKRVAHDGKSYKRLMRVKDGWQHYAAFTLMEAIAAKSPLRGWLIDENGPLSVGDMALVTECPEKVFENAVKPLLEIGWLVLDEIPSEFIRNHPGLSANIRDYPPTVQYSTDSTVHEPSGDDVEAPDKDDQFEAFWQAYPRRKAKGKAVKAYAAALKKTDAKTLVDGAKRYALTTQGRDPQYIQHPATWLNAEGWLDEDAPTQDGTAPNLFGTWKPTKGFKDDDTTAEVPA